MSLIAFLITLIVVVCIIYCVRLLLPMLGLPEPINTVIMIIIGLICLLWLLNSLGVVGAGPYVHLGYRT